MYVCVCVCVYVCTAMRSNLPSKTASLRGKLFFNTKKKIAYDSVRTSHRRANKNRKTPKCLTLKNTTPQHPPYFRRHHASGQVILDCDLVENPRKIPCLQNVPEPSILVPRPRRLRGAKRAMGTRMGSNLVASRHLLHHHFRFEYSFHGLSGCSDCLWARVFGRYFDFVGLKYFTKTNW